MLAPLLAPLFTLQEMWLEYLWCRAFLMWTAKTDQIWVFAGRTCNFVGLVVRRLKYNKMNMISMLNIGFWIFVRLSSLVLASELTTNWNKFIVSSIDFDRLMTSEGSYTLILPFTSTTGQSVGQNRQTIFFNWVFLVKRGHILAFYRPNFRLQT